jgi:hypothetical protein
VKRVFYSVYLREDLLNPHLASLNRHVPGFQQPSAIWSHAWYPYASLNNPSTFCYVLGIGDAPVRLIDGIDGRVSDPFEHPRLTHGD